MMTMIYLFNGTTLTDAENDGENGEEAQESHDAESDDNAPVGDDKSDTEETKEEDSMTNGTELETAAEVFHEEEDDSCLIIDEIIEKPVSSNIFMSINRCMIRLMCYIVFLTEGNQTRSNITSVCQVGC
jgi:hypothetical protein